MNFRPLNPFHQCLLALAFCPTVMGGEFVVTTVADSGPGSLRQALADAAANAEADTIRFAPALAGETIVLTTDSSYASLATEFGPTGLVIHDDTITIDGAQAPLLKISGGNVRRVFAITATGNLTLSDLMVTAGYAAGGNGGSGTGSGGGGGGGAGFGGAIRCDGKMLIDRSTLFGNRAVGGNGGAAGSGGENGRGGGGGGFAIDGKSGSAGGGATSPGGKSGLNSAEGTDGSFGGGGGGGGGLYIGGYSGWGGDGGFGGGGGNSRLSGGYGGGGGSFPKNGAGGAGLGGAVFVNNGAVCTLRNSTLNGNTAAGGRSGGTQDERGVGKGAGAAVFCYQGELDLLNCTIAGNSITAPAAHSLYVASGVQIYRDGTASGKLTCANSIVTSSGYSIVVYHFGTWTGTESTSSFVSNIIGSVFVSGNAYPPPVSGDPLLGALSENGGPTLTMLPGAGSPALDSGNAAAAAGLLVDQRGEPRFAGTKLDAGAVQVTLGVPAMGGLTATTSGLTAMLEGSVVKQGASAITERGVVYAKTSVNANPQIGGAGVTKIVADGTDVGAFSTLASELEANTAYSFKTYAINSLGAGYSVGSTFTTNLPPVITSHGGAASASVSVPENSVIVTTFTATDADFPSQVLSFSIAGGADADQFEIDEASGLLRFVTPPDFDQPSDAGANHVYDVIVRVSDDGNTPLSDTLSLAVAVTDLAEPPSLSAPTSAELSPTRATLGATVDHDGGGGDFGMITERGVVYAITSLNSDPQIGGLGVSQVTSPGYTGIFTLAAIELSPGTSYTYRPYAINAQGISYGSAATFTSEAGPAMTGDLWTHFSGSATGLSGTTDSSNPLNARFNFPSGIAVDGDGNPYVADTLNHTLRKSVGGTGAVSTSAGVAGSAGSANNALFVSTRFNGPQGVAWNPVTSNAYTFYLADTENHLIRRSSWTFFGGWDTSYHAGTAGLAGADDGAALTAARFHSPKGVTVGSDGSVFVADTGNDLIRKIDTAGQVSTVLGPKCADLVEWGTVIPGLPQDLTGSFEALALGPMHLLALKTDGTVAAWGANGSGQAEVPAGLSGVTAIAAGQNHSLALRDDGTVVAWGDNEFDQCSIPAGLTGVTQIATRENACLALKSDGTVVAWGNNIGGQISVPAGLGGVIAIAIGNDHALALKADGSVVGWGDNNAGQGSATGLGDVVMIAAGGAHSVALKRDGSVECWGLNTNGQATPPADLANVKAVAAGNLFTAALKNDGSVVIWGQAAHGINTIPATLQSKMAASLTAGPGNVAVLTEGSLTSPAGVAADASGNLFIADTGSHVIRKLVLATGQATVFAGQPGQSGSADGLGTAARLNSPRGITVDASGNVYVTDEADHTVRWITRDGIVRTIGGLPGTPGLANGAPEAARFKSPAGISSGGSDVYLADTGNNRLVKGTPLFRPISGIGGASDVTLTSVTIHGWVNPNGKATTAAFEYGLTTAYGSSSPVELAATSATSAQLVSAAVSGLLPDTIYHYRLTATNADGTSSTVSGTFSTAGPPLVAPLATVAGVGASSATLSGELISTGYLDLTSHGFVYAETSANSQPLVGGSGAMVVDLGETSGIFSAPISGLKPDTAYSFRAFATNTGGTSYSDVATFTTASSSSPSAAWRLQHFGTTENSGNAADLATPDGDGVANLIKYGLVITPGTNGSAGLPALETTGDGHLVLRFRRDPSRNDVDLVVEAQSGLGGAWSSIARSDAGGAVTGSAESTETSNPDGSRTVEVKDSQPISAAANRFLRVRVVHAQSE